MKGKNRIRLCGAEMYEWCQDALDRRFVTSPGQVTNVTTYTDTGGGSVFEITIQEDEEESTS